MKQLNLEISSCSECPYCKYDSYYSMGKDSGYDCSKCHKRIIDDWEWNNTNNPNRIVQDYDNSYSIPTPKWCPLKDSDLEKPIFIDEDYDKVVKKSYVNQMKGEKL